MVRRVSVLGATGSIGTQTLDLIDRAGGAEAFDVIALTGHSNVAALAEAAIRLRADVAVTADLSKLDALREALSGSDVEAAAGPDAICEAASRPADWTMSAIVGAAGLAPTLEAAQQGRCLALANKESMVCAGDLLNAVCAEHGTTLLPADSEHAAIFQCLRGETAREVERVIITASGGPFRGRTRDQMRDVTLAEAVAHPNWDMGQGISIDSATMFNKALEVIEAKYLFDLRPDQIEVIVHPQSIVHSMIGFADGSIMAQLGPPDMRGAIGYCLNYPERRDLPVDRLDFAKLASLDFHAPDLDAFPALRLVRRVLDAGGAAGAVLNAAKEAAMAGFVAGRIGFLAQADLVELALNALIDEAARAGQTLEAVLDIDQRTRSFVEQRIAQGIEQ
ncbi:1-deoxy-D-xylulose 5-phosphate reductoisomerase [Pontivivens insulae]|uniref:1-deoxy-D-xylulose 5-phosphate reductoisomerase n=1 Tax=Pontivivens insulae TaxID=1639689 RepID=A0A2R8AAP7_9RHOB|nr:1-deoxy-D-xylulose 5-phosphate reductoisomerase [Pontivivens insulae]SPF29303.1 1-deoxy-D-xylulose 5-phosphate reductoisomerase [Pontivivens insulae]